MKKILICGDSFAADWTVKYTGEGWPNLLAKDYSVTNLAQAGCSEYKIYKQLVSVDLNLFDYIIVFHTSPNRIYTSRHPVHSDDLLHGNSDLLYADIKEHSKTNKELIPIVEFFEQHFDVDHAIFSHNLLCKFIGELCEPYNTLHATGFDYKKLYQFNNTLLDYSGLAEPKLGNINHFSNKSNILIFNDIKSRLDQI